MNEKQYVIYQLNKMIEELGRVPTQKEFCTKVNRWYIQKHFGTYNNLLKSLHFVPNKDGVGRKRNE